jgi:predicted permease
MLGELFSIIAPVFICAGIGFAWERVGRGYDVGLVTDLITSIGAPCLVFHTLANLRVEGTAFATMVGATLAAMAGCAAAGALVLKLARLPLRSFLPAVIFPNTGNMGLPLNYLAFGDLGLALALGVFTVYTVGQFTLGIAIASGTVSLKALARVPLLWALAAAVLFMVAGATPPDWINATTRLLGDITIPLMLITLGISLARLKVASLPRSLGLSVLRLVLGFAIGVALAAALGLEGAARGVLIVQLAMPVAVFNYLFAQRYGTAPEEVAGMVVISTALSFASLPLLLWFVL